MYWIFIYLIIFLKFWARQPLLTVSLSKIHRQNCKHILYFSTKKIILESADKIKKIEIRLYFFLLSGKFTVGGFVNQPIKNLTQMVQLLHAKYLVVLTIPCYAVVSMCMSFLKYVCVYHYLVWHLFISFIADKLCRIPCNSPWHHIMQRIRGSSTDH